MDKYEFNIKVDQIKKLAAKKSFQEAAAIAKEMNWQKVKDWSTLEPVSRLRSLPRTMAPPLPILWCEHSRMTHIPPSHLILSPGRKSLVSTTCPIHMPP